jgi:hypothetical protein
MAVYLTDSRAQTSIYLPMTRNVTWETVSAKHAGDDIIS